MATDFERLAERDDHQND